MKKSSEIGKLKERIKFFSLNPWGNQRNMKKVALVEEVMATNGEEDEEDVEVIENNMSLEMKRGLDGSFSCVVKTQRRWSNKIYKTELTKIRYNNQVLCKYRVDPQRAGLTLIAEFDLVKLRLKRSFK